MKQQYPELKIGQRWQWINNVYEITKVIADDLIDVVLIVEGKRTNKYYYWRAWKAFPGEWAYLKNQEAI